MEERLGGGGANSKWTLAIKESIETSALKKEAAMFTFMVSPLVPVTQSDNDPKD